jgi:heat shock protein HslJ
MRAPPLFVSALLVAAITAANTSDTAQSEGSGKRWQLKSGRNLPAAGTAQPSLTIEGQKLSGTTGCNHFNATFAEDANKRVTIQQIALTRKLCGAKENSIETAVVRAMRETTFVRQDDRTLTFLSEERQPLLVWEQI